jgi:hypothetical protein
MKSKKLGLKTALIVLVPLLLGLGSFYYFQFMRSPLANALEKEWLERRFPLKVDTEDAGWQVLPFGYTLGPWPDRFHNEPIVTKLTYSKGPPKKFIQSITQLWQPVEVELTMMGPKTIVEGMKQSDWKQCFETHWSCASQKKKLFQYFSSDKKNGILEKATWFDHLEPDGPRGVHLHWNFEKYRMDDFILLTENGIAQNFELKTVKSDLGNDARVLMYLTLGSLSVNENLKNSREWVQKRISNVNLNEIRSLADRKKKLTQLIAAQNTLFSMLSVDPSQVTPFFHLAGVTHLMALELMKLDNVFFENQESWILNTKPNLDSLLKYSKDFGEDSIPKQIEALIQDVLLQQSRGSPPNGN